MKERQNRSLFRSSSDSSSKEKQFIAIDTVTQIPAVDWHHSHGTPRDPKEKAQKGAKFKLYTYTFQPSDKPFTVRDVGIIANVVHKSETAYSWKTRNCYWFARTIVDVIKEVANPTEKPHEGARWAGRAGLSNAISFNLGKRSRRSESPSVGALVHEVRKTIAENNQKVRQPFVSSLLLVFDILRP